MSRRSHAYLYFAGSKTPDRPSQLWGSRTRHRNKEKTRLAPRLLRHRYINFVGSADLYSTCSLFSTLKAPKSWLALSPAIVLSI